MNVYMDMQANYMIQTIEKFENGLRLAATDASAFLSLLDGRNVISFDQCISATGLQVVPAMGSRMPLHATSQGKVLLSCLSDREVLKILEKGGMQAFTPHTITDPQRFVADLTKVRENGYAVEDGEYRIMRCLIWYIWMKIIWWPATIR